MDDLEKDQNEDHFEEPSLEIFYRMKKMNGKKNENKNGNLG